MKEKCYTVSFTVKSVIIAKNAKEALKIAREKAIHEDMKSLPKSYFSVKLSDEIPKPYTNRCLAWHSDSDYENTEVKYALKLNQVGE